MWLIHHHSSVLESVPESVLESMTRMTESALESRTRLPESELESRTRLPESELPSELVSTMVVETPSGTPTLTMEAAL